MNDPGFEATTNMASELPSMSIVAPDQSSFYNALPTPTSFRLLNFPNTQYGSLDCELEVCNTEKHPRYKALSYTWAQPYYTTSPDERDFLPEFSSFDYALSCNGRPFRVTKNLFNAITTLVLDLKVQFLWVDAICINQADSLVERPQQVSLMGRIFEEADEVLVWLGHYVTSSIDFFWCATMFVDIVDKMINEQGTASVLARSIIDAAFVESLGGTKTLLRVQRAMDFYGRCRLFNRAWVVQEFAKAKRSEVYCGNKAIPSAGLKKLGDWFGKTNWSQSLGNYDFYGSEGNLVTIFTQQQFCRSFATWELFRDQSSSSSRLTGLAAWFAGDQHKRVTKHTFARLLESMWRLQRFQVSDDRDRIFAALGLHSDNDSSVARRMGTPTYAKSIETTYIEFSENCLRHLSSLRLFWYLDASQRRLEAEWPSWVPDWRSQILRPISTILNGCDVWKSGEVAEVPGKAICQIFSTRKRLGLHGIHVSTIAAVTEIEAESAFAGSCAFLLNCLKLCAVLPAFYKVTPDIPQARMEALWKTMTMNPQKIDFSSTSGDGKSCFHAYVTSEFSSELRKGRIRGSRGEAMKELDKVYSNLIGDCLSWQLPTLEEIEDIERIIPELRVPATPEQDVKLRPIAERALQFHTLVENFGHGRRLFKAGNDILGSGLELIRPGDHVWLLNGLNTPVILRPISGWRVIGDGHLPKEFQVVGECYLHGYMNGELFSSGKLKRNSAELITLV